VILATRNELEHQGVPRAAIDAGYVLNGEDLYRYPKHGIETMELEGGIPISSVVQQACLAGLAPLPKIACGALIAGRDMMLLEHQGGECQGEVVDVKPCRKGTIFS